MPDTRLVPMTRAQRDWLARLQFAMYHEDVANAHRASILDAWDAAPADATEAAILGTMLPNYTENDRAFVTPIVLNVLRALGMPDA